MDRCIDGEVRKDSDTCSEGCEIESPDSLGNTTTRHALDQDPLHSLSLFIVFLRNTIINRLRLGNKGKPIA